MRRTLAAPGLAAVLGMALLLTACGKTNAHNNTAGETVSTALFDFSITDVSLVESYPGIDIPDGECLVRMRLNIKNTSSQTYTMFLQDFQIQWGEGDSDYGTCLNAVDDTMMPYAYELTPGQERCNLVRRTEKGRLRRRGWGLRWEKAQKGGKGTNLRGFFED